MGYAFVFLGVIMLVLSIFQPNTETQEESQAHVNAMNFMLYREAVHDFVLADKTYIGIVSDSLLTFQTGYINKAWYAQVENFICYVYGSATQAEKNTIKDLAQGSHAIGEKQNGIFYPNYNSKNIALPDFIAEDSIVSIMELVP